jgi:NitT/TauT family transport system substrate-binding protein
MGQQRFDMLGLLNREIDAPEAMTYNEYAQLLEAKNPDTGTLYTPEDFTFISCEQQGVGMLQDAIWASGERMSDPAHRI